MVDRIAAIKAPRQGLEAVENGVYVSDWASEAARLSVAVDTDVEKLTVQTAGDEIKRLEVENVALSEELHKLRFRRMQLRDPGVAPKRRHQLVGTTWCLEMEDFTHTDEVIINSTSHHDVDVSHCSGKEGLSSLIAVKGTCKTLRLHACNNVKVHADSILFGMEMVECGQIVVVIGCEAPTITIKYCAGVGVLLCDDVMDGRLNVFKSAGVVLSNVPRTLPVMMPSDLIASKFVYTAEIPSYIRTTLNHVRFTASANIFPIQRAQMALELDEYVNEVWEGEGSETTSGGWDRNESWDRSKSGTRSKSVRSLGASSTLTSQESGSVGGGGSVRRMGTGQSRLMQRR